MGPFLSSKMSSDLTWMILRNQSSFMVKRNKTVMSSEPGNLTSQHSYKYSTLANSKVLGMAKFEDKSGRKSGITFMSKNGKSENKPKSVIKKVNCTKPFRSIARNVSATALRVRPDLEKAALARASLINRSLGAAKPVPKKKSRRAAA